MRSLFKMMKKPLGETQTLRAGCSKADPKIFARRQDGQNSISCMEMVTTFTYRPSLVKIDARKFELSW